MFLLLVFALLPKGGSAAWPSVSEEQLDDADRADRDGHERSVRRLEERWGRRLTVESADARWLQEMDQLPALQVGSLKLREVVVFHESDPLTVRRVEIPEDHDLESKGEGQRRLHALEQVVQTPLNFRTPRDTMRVLVALNAAAPSSSIGNGTGKEFLWSEWEKEVFSKNDNWMYPLPPCKNKTTSNISGAPAPQGWEDNSTHRWCTTPTAAMTPDPSSRRMFDQQSGEETREKREVDERDLLSRRDSDLDVPSEISSKRRLQIGEKKSDTPTLAPPKAPAIDEDTAKGNFERDLKYMLSARKRFRMRIPEQPGIKAKFESQFMGQRMPPCTGAKVGDERCNDDIGVSISVYEDDNNKILVYHGNSRFDMEYVRWAEKFSIVDKMQDQVVLQWTVAARQNLEPVMEGREGDQMDRMTTTCKFLNQPYGPFGKDPVGTKFYSSIDPPIAQDKADAVGLWFLIKRLTRVILPEGRNKAREREKSVLLTGSGLGGAFAALVSMWLNRVEAEQYPTYLFAPVGFQCMAHRLLLSDVNPWDEHSQIKVYMHVMDAYAELGKVSGNVCLYGLRNFTPASAAHGYCKRMVGFTGPQLMYDGRDEKQPVVTESEEQWNNYRAFVDDGRLAFHGCHYFTHSVWYAAALMADPNVLYLDGSTDGGCRKVAGVPKGDKMNVCPTSVQAQIDCVTAIVGRTPLPIGLMVTVMATLATLITAAGITLFLCLHSVKNDNWIYGREHKKYADFQGIFDWPVICPCCCKPKRRRKKLDVDRAKQARVRAKEKRHEKFAKNVTKAAQSSKGMFGLGKVHNALAQQVKARRDLKQQELDALMGGTLNLCGKDIWVQIIGATHLRNRDFLGKSDPCAVVQIGDKENSRIVTPTIENQLDPVWNHSEKLVGYEVGDEVDIAVWDEDPGSSIPEDGDFLGRVVLSSEAFWPGGMQLTALRLRHEAGGDTESTIQVAIHVLPIGAKEPPLPSPIVTSQTDEPSTDDKKDKKDRKDKKEKNDTKAADAEAPAEAQGRVHLEDPEDVREAQHGNISALPSPPPAGNRLDPKRLSSTIWDADIQVHIPEIHRASEVSTSSGSSKEKKEKKEKKDKKEKKEKKEKKDKKDTNEHQAETEEVESSPVGVPHNME